MQQQKVDLRVEHELYEVLAQLGDELVGCVSCKVEQCVVLQVFLQEGHLLLALLAGEHLQVHLEVPGEIGALHVIGDGKPLVEPDT